MLYENQEYKYGLKHLKRGNMSLEDEPRAGRPKYVVIVEKT